MWRLCAQFCETIAFGTLLFLTGGELCLFRNLLEYAAVPVPFSFPILLRGRTQGTNRITESPIESDVLNNVSTSGRTVTVPTQSVHFNRIFDTGDTKVFICNIISFFLIWMSSSGDSAQAKHDSRKVLT